jgi:mTERF domain-containing protein
MALRRLARRLATVPFPPRLLPLPIPDSPGHLRFSTSSKPHFIAEEYLVSTCGLSPEAAAKAAPRFSSLATADRPDAVLAFLRSQGLGKAQVRAIVSHHPALLLSSVDATLAPKFTALRALGLSRADAARLFALFPSALTYGVHSNLLPRVLLWLDLLGSTTLLMKWLAKAWLLKYSIDLLLKNLATLRAVGLPESRLTALVRLQPTIIMQSPHKLKALVARVDEACAAALPPTSGMYPWCLFALHNVGVHAFETKKAVVTTGFGCTDDQFADMFRRAPCFVFSSQEVLRRKVEFLSTECGLGCVVNNPVLLTFSVDKRMAPRLRALQALRSRGIVLRKTSLATVVRLPEAVFLERYIHRYKQDVPQLLELYLESQGQTQIN